MVKIKQYLYLGENGTMISPILIPNAAAQIQYVLMADEGKILTNGERTAIKVTVPESQVEKWQEIENRA